MSSTFPSILPVLPVWVGMRCVPPQIRNTLCTNHIKQQLPTKRWPRRELERETSRNPFIFYGPFGDSSVISSSILKRELTPLRSPNLWLDSVRGNSDTRFVTHWGKSGCTTYSNLFSFGKYLHSHAIFQMLVKDSTVSVMSTALAFARLTYNTPRPTGPPDCLHSRTRCTRYIELMN